MARAAAATGRVRYPIIAARPSAVEKGVFPMRLRSSLLVLSLMAAPGLAAAADVTKYDGFL